MNCADAVADFVEQGTKKLIIDLGKVTYLNSTAIACSSRPIPRFSKNKGHCEAVRDQQNINNVFVITQHHAVFDVCRDPRKRLLQSLAGKRVTSTVTVTFHKGSVSMKQSMFLTTMVIVIAAIVALGIYQFILRESHNFRTAKSTVPDNISVPSTQEASWCGGR